MLPSFIVGAAMAVMLAFGLAQASADVAPHDVVVAEAGNSVSVQPDCWRVGF